MEARVVYGRTNDRPPDAPPDSIHAIVACDLSRYGPLALAGSTKAVKVFLEDKATEEGSEKRFEYARRRATWISRRRTVVLF